MLVLKLSLTIFFSLHACTNIVNDKMKNTLFIFCQINNLIIVAFPENVALTENWISVLGGKTGHVDHLRRRKVTTLYFPSKKELFLRCSLLNKFTLSLQKLIFFFYVLMLLRVLYGVVEFEQSENGSLVRAQLGPRAGSQWLPFSLLAGLEATATVWHLGGMIPRIIPFPSVRFEPSWAHLRPPKSREFGTKEGFLFILPFSCCFFYSLDMPAAKALDFATKLKILFYLIVRKYSKTINYSSRMPY